MQCSMQCSVQCSAPCSVHCSLKQAVHQTVQRVVVHAVSSATLPIDIRVEEGQTAAETADRTELPRAEDAGLLLQHQVAHLHQCVRGDSGGVGLHSGNMRRFSVDCVLAIKV